MEIKNYPPQSKGRGFGKCESQAVYKATGHTEPNSKFVIYILLCSQQFTFLL